MVYYTDLCAHCVDDLSVLQVSHWVRRWRRQRRNLIESLKVESRHVFTSWFHRKMLVISEWSKDFTGRNGYFDKITWREDKKKKKEKQRSIIRGRPKIPYHFTDNEMIASYLMHKSLPNTCKLSDCAWRTSHFECTEWLRWMRWWDRRPQNTQFTISLMST